MQDICQFSRFIQANLSNCGIFHKGKPGCGAAVARFATLIKGTNMTKALFLPLIIVLAFFQVSCLDLFDLYTSLEEGSFWAQDTRTLEFYVVKAELLAKGEKCVIWAEKNSGVSKEKAKAIADEYDKNIRPMVVSAFGKKNFNVNTSNGKEVSVDFQGASRFFRDILDYANWWVDKNDGKQTILLLDIKDGYKKGGTSYVAGYFVPINFWPKGKLGSDAYSNGADMIYIDTYPGLQERDIKQTYATLAHELQHLVNFVTNYFLLSGVRMDTWIDEGLSAWAEYLYQGDNLVDKCEWFIADRAGTIAKGNNFFVWENHTKDKPEAILDDYATVYLFFRWLYLQAETKNLHSDLFYKIITSPKSNHTAVTDVAKEINPEWEIWENLLGAWLAANYNPKNDNYGYKGDEYLRDNIKVKPLTDDSIFLYPGEGVYSSLYNLSFTPSETGTNIRYAGLLSDNASAVNISGHSRQYTGNTLLTFNAGTNLAGETENGRLTGQSPIVPVMTSTDILSTDEIKAVEFKGPYAIDARDVMGREREKDLLLSLPGRSGR
jgi:hypothetical protein